MTTPAIGSGVDACPRRRKAEGTPRADPGGARRGVLLAHAGRARAGGDAHVDRDSCGDLPPDGAGCGFCPDWLHTLGADLTGVGEAIPQANESAGDWMAAPRPNPSFDAQPLSSASRVLGWGEVRVASGGSPATNVAVELRDVLVYVRSLAGTWRTVHYSSLWGKFFDERFGCDQDPAPAPCSQPVVPSAAEVAYGANAITVKLRPGYAYHFWTNFDPPLAEYGIDPAQVSGVVVTFVARLVRADLGLADDRASARILANAGGDYYRDLTWLGDWAIGKFKFVSPDWRLFSASSLSSATLAASAPPVCP